MTTSWCPGPPYGCMSTGSSAAPANRLDALGATIAVNSLRSPSRTKRTFGTKSGSAATLHTSWPVRAPSAPYDRRITAFAESMVRPHTTSPSPRRDARHTPGSSLTARTEPSAYDMVTMSKLRASW